MGRALTLGSLFDGSGTFPLAAIRAGIVPVWASEIEPVPIRVTRKNLPEMIHLGDVSTIDGGQIPPVDIVAFGSPCTDLSVAGKRAGLEGKASGLFFEVTRIIKQMREATAEKFPRFVVWENVPGAFSSQKGEDFAAVINTLLALTQTGAQTARALPEVIVPQEGWAKADLVVGSGFSLAWRVLDAQYWGVPQRRKRIFLIADLAGQSAPEILFDAKGSNGNLEPSSQTLQTPPRPTTSSPSDNSFGACTLRMRSGKPGGGKGPLIQHGQSGTLATRCDQILFHPICYGFNAIHKERDSNSGRYGFATSVAKTLDLHGGRATCNQGGMLVTQPHCMTTTSHPAIGKNCAPTLSARDFKQPPITTQASNHCCQALVARHLTPLECSRLQGFPDQWITVLENPDPTMEELSFWQGVFTTYARVMGKKPRTLRQVRTWLAQPVTDGALYRMWGNGIALPCAQFIMDQIAKHATT
ncbi:DNA cytosine methyltransferase [Canibacter sp. lx-72]|uniref:DNA cytosine methyltransferase n=1 Tax=Canibacter zhuwentaonis TaxID=2837491 RepID=UPI001BDC71F0|nr:DNA cytosine methyltransferase [Canibacter zhuwentaonis]MBT1017593.1 DNA cytosine methyltransferase [Canibacter zhuwentaonis]